MRSASQTVAIGSVFSLFSILASGVLHASPIILDKAGTVADVRPDPGTGLCGSVVHFKTQAMPVNTIPDAVTLLNKPVSDPDVTGRKTGIFDNLNFCNNDPSAGGDFTKPMYIDTYLPYSANNAAMPPDFTPNGDNNITMRVRGYLNVTNTLGGAPVTFAINCDDFCSLTIGKKPIIPLAHLQIAGRMAQQVIFKDVGLYPIEIIYAENTNVAFMELSRALSAEPEGAQSTGLDTTKFKLISATDMYSSIVGSNTGCQECGAPGMDCSVGNHCADGLCQACNVPDHCGATCMTCPAGARICSASKCVQCVNNTDCPSGVCDTARGQCKTLSACTDSSMCLAPEVCRPEGYCGAAPAACTSDATCLTGQHCDPAQHLCLYPAITCTTSQDCPAGLSCDTATHLCGMGPHPSPGPCQATRHAEAGRPGQLWLLLASLLALAGVCSRRWIRTARPSRRTP